MSEPRLYTITDHADPDRPYHNVQAEELTGGACEAEVEQLQRGESVTIPAFDGISQTVTITRTR